MTNARSSKPANAPVAPPKPVNPDVATLADLYAPKPYWHHPESEILRSRLKYNDEQKVLLQARHDELIAELVAHEEDIRAASLRQDYSQGVAYRDRSQKLERDIGLVRSHLDRLRLARESTLLEQKWAGELERRANTVPVEA